MGDSAAIFSPVYPNCEQLIIKMSKNIRILKATEVVADISDIFCIAALL